MSVNVNETAQPVFPTMENMSSADVEKWHGRVGTVTSPDLEGRISGEPESDSLTGQIEAPQGDSQVIIYPNGKKNGDYYTVRKSTIVSIQPVKRIRT